MDSRKLKVRILMYSLAAGIMYLFTYYMTLKEATLIAEVSSDVRSHMRTAVSFDHVISISHNGWHLVCWALYAFFPIDITTAAAITTAGFNALMAVIVIWLAEKYIKVVSDRYQSVVLPVLTSVISLMAGPLYVRFFSQDYYLGQNSPNSWHNPTVLGARPFSLLVIILTNAYWLCGEEETVQVLGKTCRKRRVYQWSLAIALAYCTLIKPSFLMTYGPACVLIILYELITGKRKSFWKTILAHLYFIPAVCILLWQYLYIYLLSPLAKSEEASGIAVRLFYAAGMYTRSIAVSWILKMAFPTLVVIIFHKVVFRDKLFRLVFINYLCGLAMAWTLTETGYRSGHGNFGWGENIGCSLLWVYCTIIFVRELVARFRSLTDKPCTLRDAKYAVPLAVLLWHLAAGLSYYSVLLHNSFSQF